MAQFSSIKQLVTDSILILEIDISKTKADGNNRTEEVASGLLPRQLCICTDSKVFHAVLDLASFGSRGQWNHRVATAHLFAG